MAAAEPERYLTFDRSRVRIATSFSHEMPVFMGPEKARVNHVVRVSSAGRTASVVRARRVGRMMHARRHLSVSVSIAQRYRRTR
jgi:hypothetical protein